MQTGLYIFSVGIAMLFMLSLWIIDISASAISLGVNPISLAGYHDPKTTYHIGIIFNILSFMSSMILFALSTDYFIKSENKKHKQ